MKREIKFRVWDNVDYMSSSFTLQHLQERKIQFTPDCIVMQFTGLKDKNGKEIYEGDILDTNWIISFKNGMFGIFDKSHYMGINQYMSDFREVIGNIHEHEHLLSV